MPRSGRSNTMARIYKGRPDTFRTDLVNFEYGCHALSTCKNSKLYIKLFKLHNKILRVIMGYRISTPIIVMQSELGEFPIIDRFQLISDKFLIKTFQSACHPIFSVLNRLSNILRYSEPKLDQIENFLFAQIVPKIWGLQTKSPQFCHTFTISTPISVHVLPAIC